MGRVRRAMTAKDWAHAAALVHDHLEWTRLAAGVDLTNRQPAVRNELDEIDTVYSAPRGALFLAHLGYFPVGTAGLKWHDDGSAELKRMYLRPIARGRGLGDELVAAVTREAVAGGAGCIWLETLPGAMDAAITVYRRNGFTVVRAEHCSVAVEGIIRMERPLGAEERCA